MKHIRKTSYVRVARKMLLMALPAALLMFGSCNSEDEVIELTPDDLAIVTFEEVDPEYESSPDHFMKEAPEILVQADGEAETGQISSSGPVRLILSTGTNFSGTKMRFWTSNPSSSTANYSGNYYYKSIVVPPFMKAKLTNDQGVVAWKDNTTGASAKYFDDLGSDFTASGRYIDHVTVYSYNNHTTSYNDRLKQQFCGFAYTDANYNGKSFPVFRSTAMSETDLEGYGFNFFESFQSISDSECEAVTFVNTDGSANDNTKVSTSGDNTDLGLATYDAFYPEVSFDELIDSSTYDSDSVDDMMDAFALAVSDGSTTVSQDETDSCNSGYTICKTTVTSLQFVATVATKLTCGGFLAIWSLGTSVLNLIMTGQWWQLGIIAGDAMVTAVKITSGLATPIGEFDALICAVGVITKTLTSALDVGLCNTLKNKCTTTAATTNQD